MGRILQIRVSAWTYDEDEVCRAWPLLTALVWEQLDRWGQPGMRRGVTELAEYLPDSLRFGSLLSPCREQALAAAEGVTTALEAMRSALANWDPREANRQSDLLEEALDRAEQVLNAYPAK